MIPVYERMWKASGYDQPPISFDGLSHSSMRRMAGNSFNQAVATSFAAFVLCHMKKKQT